MDLGEELARPTLFDFDAVDRLMFCVGLTTQPQENPMSKYDDCGVLYIVWPDSNGSMTENERLLARSIASLERTNPGLKHYVYRAGYNTHGPDGLLIKAEMDILADQLEMPAKRCFLDIDTVVLGDISEGFTRASESHCVLARVCENPNLERFTGIPMEGIAGSVEWNTGVIFWRSSCLASKQFFAEWHAQSCVPAERHAIDFYDVNGKPARMAVNDQGSFGVAAANYPATVSPLKPNWNVRPGFDHVMFGQPVIWHHRSDPPEQISKWGPNEIHPGREWRLTVPPLNRSTDKTLMIMTAPRMMFTNNALCLSHVQKALNLNYRVFQGAYFEQGMQRALETATQEGYEKVIAFDYDTYVGPAQVAELLNLADAYPDYVAIVPIQCQRHRKKLLASVKNPNATGPTQVTVENGKLVDIASGHFGATVIRLSLLKNVPKPWLWSQPDSTGGWNDEPPEGVDKATFKPKIDADIWFWHQIAKAGGKVGMANVRVGHQQEMVSFWDNKQNDWVQLSPGEALRRCQIHNDLTNDEPTDYPFPSGVFYVSPVGIEWDSDNNLWLPPQEVSDTQLAYSEYLINNLYSSPNLIRR